jgi:hypothetical protein
VATAALAGAVGLVTGSLGLGETVTARLPFASRRVAGAALAAVVGAPMARATVDAWRGTDQADATAVVAGTLLMGWIVVEVGVIRTVSWLQPLCFAAGACIAVAGWNGRAHEGQGNLR